MQFIEFVKRTDCEESTAESGQLVEESVVNISEDNWVSSFMSAEVGAVACTYISFYAPLKVLFDTLQ